MRLVVALALVLSLTVLAGCAQTRCATQGVCNAGNNVGRAVSNAGRSVGRTASNAWQSVSCTVERATDCSCQPEPETVITCPVYADGCGGDMGVGRTGTGAFRIPAGP